MSGRVTCFMLDPTERVRLSLRRFRHGGGCSGASSYHNALAPIGEAPILWAENPPAAPRSSPRRSYQAPAVDAYAGDPRWPTHCGCGETFGEDDEWQVFVDRVYVRRDTGAEIVLGEAGPGAMWDADWYHGWREGPDGRSIVVILPNGRQWFVDGPANNCTAPTDMDHHCWVRTGEPPLITVSKSAPGQRTCDAGGGSIQAGDYHGFLQNGAFT